MINNLINYLSTLEPVPEKELREISLLFKSTDIKKGVHFLKQGEVQENIGFLIHGLFRCYYIGNEHTKHFLTDNDFLFALSALITRKPAQFFIQALEDSVVLTASAEKIGYLMSNNNFWRKIYIQILEKACLIKEERTADFLLKNAKERYLSFYKEHPELVNRIKRYQLSSFLGIKPESLSRIRKNLNCNIDQ